MINGIPQTKLHDISLDLKYGYSKQVWAGAAD